MKYSSESGHAGTKNSEPVEHLELERRIWKCASFNLLKPSGNFTYHQV
jgi:hypothetical protein